MSDEASYEAFLEAVKAGDLQEIKRLHQRMQEFVRTHGTPWNAYPTAKELSDETVRLMFEKVPVASRAAAEGGHLECLKYCAISRTR